jgi:anti-sigma factor RsiW
MNVEDRDHLMLAAYLDGELSPGETLEMDRKLRADPKLRRLRDELSSLSGSIRDLVAATPVPSDLAERSRERFAVVSVLPKPRKPSYWRSIAAALVMGLLVGGPAGYGLSHVFDPARTSAIEDAIFANHLRGLAAPQPFDIASSDRHTVKPWFNGRTAIAPDAPDLSAQGFPLVGGRVDIVDGKTVPTLIYRRRQHVISVTIVPRTDDGSGGVMRREGSQIRHWSASDLSYFATSDLNAKELGEFATLFRSVTAPAD